MPEILRYPSMIASINHANAKVFGGNIYYVSYLFGASSPPQQIGCLLLPAQRHVVMSIRMMITTRTGTTSNPCQFQFRIANAATGAPIFTFPTVPPVLSAMALPVMTWIGVHTSAAGQVVNPGEYLGVFFTGVAGTKVVGSNDLEIYPTIEVLIN